VEGALRAGELRNSGPASHRLTTPVYRVDDKRFGRTITGETRPHRSTEHLHWEADVEAEKTSTFDFVGPQPPHLEGHPVPYAHLQVAIENDDRRLQAGEN